MTIGNDRIGFIKNVIDGLVAFVERNASVEESIEFLAWWDARRKGLDAIQANPHLWAQRDAAMRDAYRCLEEAARQSGVNDVQSHHDQAANTPDPAHPDPAAHYRMRSGGFSPFR